MASNLDYLDPALIPLEEKVAAYLTTEKTLRRATDAGQTERLTTRDKKPASTDKSAALSAKDKRKTGADERVLRDQVQKLDAQLSKLHAKLIFQSCQWGWSRPEHACRATRIGRVQFFSQL